MKEGLVLTIDGASGYFPKEFIIEAIKSHQTLSVLVEKANEIEYMHNFQLERSDIVKYVYQTHDILRVLKGGCKA